MSEGPAIDQLAGGDYDGDDVTMNSSFIAFLAATLSALDNLPRAEAEEVVDLVGAQDEVPFSDHCFRHEAAG